MDASMVTGIVKENWNEEQPGRIRVEYGLGVDGKRLSGWLPVMTGYCKTEYGSLLLPEVGTEVVVGFLNGSPDCPFVMGCLQGLADTPLEGVAKEENPVRMMRTEGGCLTLDIKEKLEFKIEGEPFLTFEKGRITLASDVKINGQKIELKAEKGLTVSGASVTLRPSQTLELGADKTKVEGMTLELKGTASAKLEANGLLEVKGNIVKLN